MPRSVHSIARLCGWLLPGPKGMPRPLGANQKNLWASLRTAEQRHLLVNRRKTSPTAMGRTSPFSFARATKLAPAKCIDSERGPLPLAKMLTTDSNACRAAPCSAPQTASSKCWARRPEGPGAEDLENACRHLRISSAGIRQSITLEQKQTPAQQGTLADAWNKALRKSPGSLRPGHCSLVCDMLGCLCHPQPVQCSA